MIIQFIGTIVLAAIARHIIGIIWYSKKGLFGKAWIALQGLDPKTPSISPRSKLSVLFSFLLTVVSTFIFTLMVMGEIEITLVPALVTAGLFWIGFIVPSLYSRMIYDPRREYIAGLFWIDALYELVALVSAALILNAFL
jgi:hypothetical protein